MNLPDVLTAGFLMQTIDVLRDHAVEFTLLLHFSKLPVRVIGLDRAAVEVLSEVIEEYG